MTRVKKKIERMSNCHMVDYILIDKKFAMYDDGIVRNVEDSEDIPQWIFDFRDFVLENSAFMSFFDKKRR